MNIVRAGTLVIAAALVLELAALGYLTRTDTAPSPADMVLQTARAEGASAALTLLERHMERDPALRFHSHHVAHETGRIAIERSAFDLSVLSDCTLNFASGCVHGVLERYFHARPSIADTSVASFCDELVPDRGLTAWKLECTHGLGHGLAVRSNHDPAPALHLCDRLVSHTERRECHDGVFMEVTSHALGGGHPDDPGPGPHAEPVAAAQPPGDRAHDHGSPMANVEAPASSPGCEEIDEAYRESCWAYQYLFIHAASDGSWSRTAAGCRSAGEQRLIRACVFGVGKQVAQAHSGDWTSVYEFCLDLSADQASACASGAVEHLIDFDWSTERAAAFCAGAPADLRSDCYFRLGTRLGFAVNDDDAVARCAAPENDASEACRRGLAQTRGLQAAGA